MTSFILLAATLVLLAVIFLVYSLRNTQRRTALFLIMVIPAATVGLYFLLGNPAAIDQKSIAANPEQAPLDINTAIAQLEQSLKDNPSNLDGWLLLGRSHMEMGNYEPALAAFKKAREISPDNPDIKSEQAEAMLRASGKREFSPEALALLEEAAKTDPNNQRALFFLGMHYLQQGDGPKAENYLQLLLPKLDPEAAKALQAQIDIAREQQGKPSFKTDVASNQNADSSAPSVNVSIDIAPDLIGKIKPNAVLFVFAKIPDGAGPPVAAKRIAINGFPINISLSDSDSLMPTAKFSSQKKVQIIARLSHNGIANAQTGDIEAEAVLANTQSKDTVLLRLSKVLP
jgi:cytochrome c-type biogenesis protein CcmH